MFKKRTNFGELPIENIILMNWLSAAKQYEKGEYSKALEGFRKTSAFNEEFRVRSIPFIAKCENVLNKPLTKEKLQHEKKLGIQKRVGWIDKIKYLTGTIATYFMVQLAPDEENEWVIEEIFQEPINFMLALIFVLLTFFIHKTMKKFKVTKGLLRCKYCGQYTPYVDPNVPTFGFRGGNNCWKCGRMYPMPTIQWDGWAGLFYMEKRHSVPDNEFYIELTQMKKKYSKEIKWFKKYHLNK